MMNADVEYNGWDAVLANRRKEKEDETESTCAQGGRSPRRQDRQGNSEGSRSDKC